MTAKLVIFFAAANSIGRLRVEADLPELVGSEKQIKWATEIRDRKLLEFARKIGERQVARAMGRRPIDGMPPFDASTNFTDVETIVAGLNIALAASGKLDKMIAQTAATYWIDNRDADPVTLGKAAR